MKKGYFFNLAGRYYFLISDKHYRNDALARRMIDLMALDMSSLQDDVLRLKRDRKVLDSIKLNMHPAIFTEFKIGGYDIIEIRGRGVFMTFTKQSAYESLTVG